jgi:hypothetical protein
MDSGVIWTGADVPAERHSSVFSTAVCNINMDALVLSAGQSPMI